MSSENVKALEYTPGTDITVQLRTDLTAGRDVKIPAGHFYISESIIVKGYSGTLMGAGKHTTIIEATQSFKGSGEPMFSAGEEVTDMFGFYWSKGDVTCENLTLLVTSNSPAEAHNNPFLGNLTTIDNAIVVAGIHEKAESGITVTFNNLLIKGADSADALSRKGKNLVYPLIVTGLQGAPKPISAIIKNCEIENSGSDAIAYWAVFGGSGIIIDNEIKNCYSGIRTFSLTDPLTMLGELTIKENKFRNLTRPDRAIRNLNTWSSYCFKKNTLDGRLLPDDCQ